MFHSVMKSILQEISDIVAVQGIQLVSDTILELRAKWTSQPALTVLWSWWLGELSGLSVLASQ